MIEYINYNILLENDQPVSITQSIEPSLLKLVTGVDIQYIVYSSNQGTNNQDNKLVFMRTTPAYSHLVVHNLGQLPVVEVYSLGGSKLPATITSTISTVTVSFDGHPEACIIVVS